MYDSIYVKFSVTWDTFVTIEEGGGGEVLSLERVVRYISGI